MSLLPIPTIPNSNLMPMDSFFKHLSEAKSFQHFFDSINLPKDDSLITQNDMRTLAKAVRISKCSVVNYGVVKTADGTRQEFIQFLK